MTGRSERQWIGGRRSDAPRAAAPWRRRARRFGALAALSSLSAITVVGSALAGGWVAAGGTGWTLQPTPNPATADISYLAAVACSSRYACTAVGGSSRSLSSSSRMLAERWNDGRWRLQSIPTPSGTSGGLTGVACPSARWCVAVGYVFHLVSHRNTTLVEVWNGRRWLVQQVPTKRAPSSLYGVSCTTTSSCVAVGQTVNTPHQGIAERWNGKTWRMQRLPRLAKDTALSAVSCSRARACTAVGWNNRTGSTRPLALAWNGRRWRIQRVPLSPVTLPPGASRAGLFEAVACTSARACTAAGTDFNDPSSPLLAERWNGRRWRVQPTPAPTDWTASLAQPVLDGVSCGSPSACTAIGEYNPGHRTQYFLGFWNGRVWRLQAVPHPADFAHGALLGISCRLGHCTAVGAYTGAVRLQMTLAMAR